MSSEAAPSPAQPLKGLPPVSPPTGKMLAQFFFVPLVIVGVVVAIVLGVLYLTGGWSSPEYYLKKLDNPNPDQRWRAAADLANNLRTNDELASNVGFALDIGERARRAFELQQTMAGDLRANGRAEDAQVSTKQQALQEQQSFVLYLNASLGNFMVPVGLPLLREMATAEESSGPAPAAVALRQRQAVQALYNLAVNLRRFDALPPEQQELVKSALKAESAGPSGPRREWAAEALGCLEAPRNPNPVAPGVGDCLVRCGQSPYPFMRLLTALAASYWESDAAENARVDQMLESLLSDDGRGAEEEKQLLTVEGSPAAPNQADRRLSGLEIRFQAAAALARRGSPRAPLAVLRGMLDEGQLRQACKRKLAGGQEAVDDEEVFKIISSGLNAVVELHRRDPHRDLATLKPAIDILAQNGSLAVRKEAQQALAALAG